MVDSEVAAVAAAVVSEAEVAVAVFAVETEVAAVVVSVEEIEVAAAVVMAAVTKTMARQKVWSTAASCCIHART